MIHAKHFAVDKTWKFVLRDLNLDVNEILRLAGLTEDLFNRKNAVLTAEEYFRLWNSLAQFVNNPLFPLMLGRIISVEAFNPPIFAAFCSPNMGVAVRRLSRYKQLIGPMTLDVASNDGSTTISLGCLYTEHPMPDSLILMELVFLVNLFRLATREEIAPIRVSSTVKIPNKDAYTEYFGIQPVSSTGNEISFSNEDIERPFLSENKAMWEFFEPQLRKNLAEMSAESGFSEKVRTCLFEMIPSGLVSSEDVAKRLAVSKRTLQRYLSDENTSFQQQLKITREKLARHYLKNPELTNAQISFLLGFNDPNSFVRAFHKWTGETPGKMREKIIV